MRIAPFFVFLTLPLLASGCVAKSPATTPPSPPDAKDEEPGSDALVDAPTSDEITFRFNWPSAEVAVNYTQFVEPTSHKTAGSVTGRYVMEVTKHGATTALSLRDFSIAEGTVAVGGLKTLISPEGMLSDGVISDGGDSFTVSSFDFLRQAYRELQAEAFPAGSGRNAAVDRLLEAASQDDSLRAAANTTFVMLVGSYAGGTVNANEVVTGRSDAPVPLPGTPIVKMTTTQSFRKGVNCGPEGEPECVEVTLTSSFLEPKKVAQVVSEAVSSASGVEGRIDAVNLGTEAVYVVRPETLQPYQIEVRKTSGMAGVDQKNQKFDTRQTAGWSSSFVWK
jgi:hypothetical protein